MLELLCLLSGQLEGFWPFSVATSFFLIEKLDKQFIYLSGSEGYLW